MSITSYSSRCSNSAISGHFTGTITLLYNLLLPAFINTRSYKVVRNSQSHLPLRDNDMFNLRTKASGVSLVDGRVLQRSAEGLSATNGNIISCVAQLIQSTASWRHARRSNTLMMAFYTLLSAWLRTRWKRWRNEPNFIIFHTTDGGIFAHECLVMGACLQSAVVAG